MDKDESVENFGDLLDTDASSVSLESDNQSVDSVEVKTLTLGDTSVIAIRRGDKIAVGSEGRVTVKEVNKIKTEFIDQDNFQKTKIVGNFILVKAGNCELSEKKLKYFEKEIRKNELSLASMMDGAKELDPENVSQIGVFGFDDKGEAQMLSLTGFKYSYPTSGGEKIEAISMGSGERSLMKAFIDMTNEREENLIRRNNPKIDQVAILCLLNACLTDPGSGGVLTLAEINKGKRPRITMRDHFLNCVQNNFHLFEKFFRECVMIHTERVKARYCNESKIRLAVKNLFQEISDFKVFVQGSDESYRIIKFRSEDEKTQFGKKRLNDIHNIILQEVPEVWRSKVVLSNKICIDGEYMSSIAAKFGRN